MTTNPDEILFLTEYLKIQAGLSERVMSPPRYVTPEYAILTVSASFSSSELRKWRERLMERDSGLCRMCMDSRHLEAHHCRPKSLFPELAYDDNNGIMLCFRCHRVIVHGSNTFDLTSWQKFLPLWQGWDLAMEVTEQ